jgi:glutamate/tyrosine decarboxylase-like PLP-dependent enzyme
VELAHWLSRAVSANEEWAARFGSYAPHPATEIDDAAFHAAFEEFDARMADNYPFFHPRYAGQMVKPPHPAAVVGYLAAMLRNPNNHAREGGPATCDMEVEVVAQLAEMFGLGTHLGHLTGGGTMANLEALYVARQSHPDLGVAYSVDSHFSHARMCRLLRMPGHPVAVDAAGRMDLAALSAVLRDERIGTVVVTAGTTGTGAVDPIHEVVEIARRHRVRVHVDAAYGGFFALLAGAEGIAAEPWQAIRRCDSVVVDPHKHGLQPYGCGAVLFTDPAVARHFRHDSSYTYFTPADLHLGEISLECSRAGAAAAALWLTFRVLPPTPDGLGRLLAASRRAATGWAERIDGSSRLRLYQRPELDIVTYLPARPTLSEVDTATDRMLRDGMTDPDDPVYLSVLRADADAFRQRHPDLVRDRPDARVLRSVLIKPEAETELAGLHERIERLAGERSTRCPTPA